MIKTPILSHQLCILNCSGNFGESWVAEVVIISLYWALCQAIHHQRAPQHQLQRPKILLSLAGGICDFGDGNHGKELKSETWRQQNYQQTIKNRKMITGYWNNLGIWDQVVLGRAAYITQISRFLVKRANSHFWVCGQEINLTWQVKAKLAILSTLAFLSTSFCSFPPD